MTKPTGCSTFQSVNNLLIPGISVCMIIHETETMHVHAIVEHDRETWTFQYPNCQ